MNYTNQKNYIQIMMSGTMSNPELTSKITPDVVHKIREDVMVYYVTKEERLVTYEDLKNWNISTEELHQQAISNINVNDYAIYSVDSVVTEYQSIEVVPTGVMSQLSTFEESMERLDISDKMYVLSNREKELGARAVLNPQILAALSEKFENENFYIIPSSINEVIIMNPVSYSIDPVAIDQMIFAINQELAIEDILSSHVMVYDATSEVLMIEGQELSESIKLDVLSVEELNQKIDVLTQENRQLKGLLREHGIKVEPVKREKSITASMSKRPEKLPKPKVIKAPSR